MTHLNSCGKANSLTFVWSIVHDFNDASALCADEETSEGTNTHVRALKCVAYAGQCCYGCSTYNYCPCANSGLRCVSDGKGKGFCRRI